MLPVRLLAYIVKISGNDIALNIILAFNIKKVDEFIDMLVERRNYGEYIAYSIHNILHCRYGPAVISLNGTKIWYYTGKIHRIDGPAIIYNNCNRERYQNGLLHREVNEHSRNPGPAIENLDGSGKWCIYGIPISITTSDRINTFFLLATQYPIEKNEIYIAINVSNRNIGSYHKNII